MLRGHGELPGRGHRRRRVAFSGALALLLTAGPVGCAKDAADTAVGYSFNGDGLTVGGLYNLTVSQEPDPPTVGGADLDIFLTAAADDAPVEQADVAVVVSDAAGAAIPAAPMVGIEGGGSYVASWYYPEAGPYSIRFNIEDSEIGYDYAVLYVTVY